MKGFSPRGIAGLEIAEGETKRKSRGLSPTPAIRRHVPASTKAVGSVEQAEAPGFSTRKELGFGSASEAVKALPGS